MPDESNESAKHQIAFANAMSIRKSQLLDEQKHLTSAWQKRYYRMRYCAFLLTCLLLGLFIGMTLRALT